MSGPTLAIPVRLEIRGLTMTGLQMASMIFGEELRIAFEDIGLHVTEQVKEYILDLKNKNGAPALHNTGALIDSIAYLPQPNGVAVGTNLIYGRFQELGTVPHFVPFSMAPSLRNQAEHEWGWKPPAKKTDWGKINKGPGAAVVHEAGKGPGGMGQVTGKSRTYLTMHTDKIWLCPKPGGRPVWGVKVSGRAQPFLFPAWELSRPWCEERLKLAAQQAGERINAGGA
jgi:hypothetical protein